MIFNRHFRLYILTILFYGIANTSLAAAVPEDIQEQISQDKQFIATEKTIDVVTDEPETSSNPSDYSLSFNFSKSTKVNILGVDPADSNDILSKLNSQQQSIFLHRRKVILTRIANFLKYGSFVISFGKVTKSKIKQIFKRDQNNENLTIKAKANEIFESTLLQVDSTIWDQAQLLVDRDADGGGLIIGFQNIHGFGTHAKGLFFYFGLSYSIDYKTEEITFQLLYKLENPVRIYGVATTLGVSFNLYGFMSKLSDEQKENGIEGSTYYPMGFPGAVSIAKNYFSFGVSPSYGWPPGIPLVFNLADFQSYLTKFRQTPLIKVKTTKLYPVAIFFITKTKAVFMSIKDFSKSITQALAPQPMSCSRIFIHASN